jgi:hypothetical protein
VKVSRTTGNKAWEVKGEIRGDGYLVDSTGAWNLELALSLKPSPQPLFALVIFQIGFQIGTGLNPPTYASCVAG